MKPNRQAIFFCFLSIPGLSVHYGCLGSTEIRGGKTSEGGAAGAKPIDTATGGAGGSTSLATGGGGQIGGSGIKCQLDQDCPKADLVNCVCEGCDPTWSECTSDEDCVCNDCSNNDVCLDCEDNGWCDPLWEACSCADCVDHPLCN